MKAMFGAVWRGLRTHIRALVILVGLGVVGVVVLTGGTYVASQNPAFCKSCHYMDPYYRQWETSSHSETSCVACHPFRPVTNAVSALRYLTDTQDSRPRAEIPDGLCLQSGCHETRILQAASTFKEKVSFDHAAHTQRLRRGKRLRCTSCHSQIVQGEHISVTAETCYLCHFKGVGEAQAIGGCTTCHGTPSETLQEQGFIFSHDSYLKVGVSCQQCHLQVSEGEGAVPKERCFTCHVERTERYDDSEFLHRTHVTVHDVDCFQCHETIRHGKIKMIRALEPSCENCHKGLHSPQKDMYIGTGGIGSGDTPSRMFAAQVSCDGCHTRTVHVGTREFEETSLEPERQSCVTCHGSGYDDMMDDWLRETKRLVDTLGPEVKQAEASLVNAERRNVDASDSRILIEKARHNYDFLKFGRGAHNVEYAANLARASAGYIDKAMGKLSGDYVAPKRPSTIATPDGYCTAMCHTRLGLPADTRFDQMTFPHELHADGLEVECTKCHSPEKHKMRIITRSECMSCHHEAQDIACGHCHPSQQALYTGQVADLGVSGDPDVMFEAEVECDGCHDLSGETTFAGLKEMCVECHEAEYGDMLTEWVTEIQGALGRSLVNLDRARRFVEASRRKGGDVVEPEALIRKAERMIRLVESGKGTHNYPLSLELLESADGKLEDALNRLGRQAATP